jgi:chitodextrinase
VCDVVSYDNLLDRRTVLRSLGAVAGLSAAGAAVDEEFVSAQTEFAPLGRVDLSSAAEAVADEDGQTAYVALDAGVASVDISDPNTPEVLAKREGTGITGVYDVKTSGDRLIVVGPANRTGQVNGMGLYDVSDPANPERLSLYETEYSIHNAFLTDDTAYLINNEGTEMVAVDVTDDEPTELSRWSLAGASILHDLWIQDGVAYLNYWDDGTVMLDVSDPADPTRIGKVRDGSSRSPDNDHYVATSEDGSIVAIGGEQLGSRNLGVELWDVSNKQNTEFLAKIEPPEEPADGERTSHNFDISNDHLYTSWYDGGLKVHDISDPSNPEEVASWRGDASLWVVEVAVEGETLIASDTSLLGGSGGLLTFPDPADVGGEDPEDPEDPDEPEDPEDPTEPPTATFEAPDSATSGESLSFDATGSSDPDGQVTGYEWSFGDGTSATGPSPTHTYESAGEYTVTLEVTDDDGLTDSASATVSVAAEQTPKAVISASTFEPEVGESVTLDGTDSSSPDGEITEYLWESSRGSVTGPTATLSRRRESTVDITLTVTDESGETASTTKTFEFVDDGFF